MRFIGISWSGSLRVCLVILSPRGWPCETGLQQVTILANGVIHMSIFTVENRTRRVIIYSLLVFLHSQFG